MPIHSSNNPAGRPENEFSKTRRIYYEKKSRSPKTNVVASGNSAKKIRNMFCPMHGEEAIFDDLVRHNYIYKCCGMTVSSEVSGLNIRDDGITTIDGRATRSPLYNTTSGGGPGVMIPSNRPRSGGIKKMPLSADDQLLVKQGYTLIHIQEDVKQPTNLAKSFDGSSPVDLADYDILDKFRRSRGLRQ